MIEVIALLNDAGPRQVPAPPPPAPEVWWEPVPPPEAFVHSNPVSWIDFRTRAWSQCLFAIVGWGRTTSRWLCTIIWCKAWALAEIAWWVCFVFTVIYPAVLTHDCETWLVSPFKVNWWISSSPRPGQPCPGTFCAWQWTHVRTIEFVSTQAMRNPLCDSPPVPCYQSSDFLDYSHCYEIVSRQWYGASTCLQVRGWLTLDLLLYILLPDIPVWIVPGSKWTVALESVLCNIQHHFFQVAGQRMTET